MSPGKLDPSFCKTGAESFSRIIEAGEELETEEYAMQLFTCWKIIAVCLMMKYNEMAQAGELEKPNDLCIQEWDEIIMHGEHLLYIVAELEIEIEDCGVGFAVSTICCGRLFKATAHHQNGDDESAGSEIEMLNAVVEKIVEEGYEVDEEAEEDDVESAQKLIAQVCECMDSGQFTFSQLVQLMESDDEDDDEDE